MRQKLARSSAWTFCLQLPTLTQLVLEFSALENSSPDIVRGPVGALDGLALITPVMV